MSLSACEFLEIVRRRQHRFWWSLFIWCIGIVIFVGTFTSIFGDKYFQIIQIVVYGSILLIFFPPLIKLHKLKCPFCQGSAGALMFYRYRFLYCRSCGERIECKKDGAIKAS